MPGPEYNLQAPANDPFRLPPARAVRPADGIGWKAQLFLLLLGAFIVFLRRPDAITTPQFFAEDGSVWFSDAYRLGFWHSVLLPDAGYLQTLPRLVAGLATLVPLLYAPLLMSVIGIFVQVLPLNLLASARLATLATLPFRLLIGLAYLALPNTREINVVITNAQWHLAMIACLLIVAAPPQSVRGRVFDTFVLVLSGLTGPFCLLLLPVNALLWWVRRKGWLLVTGAILAVCSALQLVMLLNADPVIRHSAPLGASLRLFIEILAGHVFLPSLFGSGGYSSRLPFPVLAVVAIAGISVFGYVLAKAGWELRAFLLFCLLVFAASLKSPLVSRTQPQWPILNQVSGIRYWFFPTLAFVWSLFWCAKAAPQKVVRTASVAVLVLSVAGVARDWQYPAFPDQHFPEYVRMFQALPAGETLTFPLYPNGWTMQLVKRSACSEKPVGVIDEPIENQRASGLMTVRGWVNGPAPIRSVQVFIDNTQAGETAPSLPRADVDAVAP